ncbi:hypothetical protein CDV36_011917 [Fusarium kuroshium]|uniref:Uncharacterized protein n=1 Tax=Fusarium kuroshium TaxID=2010991 RepID=A0A3M2RT54_9HYPO|nr:hypothetical protein CDV36_011917 [Fusarium kuroshium]
MDPLYKLPPELRLNILLLLRCKRSMLRFAQASPVILQQYLTSKSYITRKLITMDFDEEMMQDAMGIILLPSSDTLGDYSEVLHQHLCAWSAQQLPNPLRTGDDSLIDQLDKLQNKLLLFIEDYLTKATAIFPPREYLCLPALSSSRTQLMFKDQEVSPRFDATELTDEERKRLLRAFLRYELICSMFNCRTSWDITWDRVRLYKYAGRKFRPSEREAIRCVHQYLTSLYAAMFAQCSDSWLPDTPVGSLSSHTTGLLYPDTLYIDTNAYASDMGLQGEEISLSNYMAGFGFDLATALIRHAIAGRHGRGHLEHWLRDLFRNGDNAFPPCIPPNNYLYLGSENEDGNDVRCTEDSGMYNLLHKQLLGTSSLHASIYRQRAWVFFDDNRLYPSSSPAGSHFPTLDELGEPISDTIQYEEWFSNPKRARALHRSQKWHDERLGKPGGEGIKESVGETACETLLPVTTERDWFLRVPRFWS